MLCGRSLYLDPLYGKVLLRIVDMIEILFSESAAGGLKAAQGYGRGKYPGGCTSVILRKKDGGSPSPAEIERARLVAEEKERLAWENASPIGGSPGDVYCFELALSFGDISEGNFWSGRRTALEQTCAWALDASELLAGMRRRLNAVLERCASEPVRIWISENPDEVCGMHWLLSMLIRRACEIRIVKLPAEELHEDTLCEYCGWGELLPGEWHRFLKYEEVLSALQLRARVSRWRELQEENMPLRAVVSGRLTSLKADAFDHFIRMEIDGAEAQFRQARVMGNVLGKHPLGFGDGFIALRMEEMIRAGELEIVQEAGEGEPPYRRVLQKTRI